MTLGPCQCDEEKTFLFFFGFDRAEESGDTRTRDRERELEDIDHSASSPVTMIESRYTDDAVFETF